VLFLDEPTTGLDPISRASVWQEVQRLNEELGMTILLTTQYLEEADVLADRVGIIDHGHIVAEGTPDALKAEIGRPSVEATPADRAERDAIAAVLAQFGAAVPAPPGIAAVRLDNGNDLTAVVRALDANNLTVADLQLHQPSLDDVFLAKTGRKLEGSADDANAPAPADAGGGRGRRRRGR
jgi:ABC-2 type transport system ATP-binding protein